MWALYHLSYAYNILINVIYAFEYVIYFVQSMRIFFVDFALSFICFGIVMQICGRLQQYSNKQNSNLLLIWKLQTAKIMQDKHISRIFAKII